MGGMGGKVVDNLQGKGVMGARGQGHLEGYHAPGSLWHTTTLSEGSTRAAGGEGGLGRCCVSK